MVLDRLPPDLRPTVQVIDTWFENRRLGLIFEATVNSGKLIVCSIDLKNDLDTRPVARQMRHSLLQYMAGGSFAPAHGLTVEQVRSLFKEPTTLQKLGVTASAANSAVGYEASCAIDGDPTTIWHTPWQDEVPPLPHTLEIDLQQSVAIRSVQLLQRQDMANGRIKMARIYLSDTADRPADPAMETKLSNDAKQQSVQFDRPRVGRYLWIEAVSTHDGRPWAALAEVDVQRAQP